MRVVFAGTPDFAVPALRALAVRDEVVAVYTQPDRPSGRGRALTPSPVKLEAVQRGIPVLQPQSLRSKLSRDALRALQPDLMVVVAYGLILPPRILDIPLQGCWNLHASLLPRWRGAAPIQRAIEAGDRQTGICLMQMDQGLDTGAVLLTRAIDIGAQETAGELHDRLAELGAQVLADGLGLMRANLRPMAQPQDDAAATYARKLDKAEALLDFSLPAGHLANQVRAFNPWPIAEMQLGGERIRIHAAHAIESADVDAAAVNDGSPGHAIGQPFAASRDGIDIRCGVGALRITRLQRDGGKAMAVADFVNARRDLPTSVTPKVQWTFGKA